jgi:ferrous iron transport protein B
VPPFLLGTFLLWALQAIGVLPWLIGAGEPLVVAWLGLPREASAALLIGVLRRDFAAALPPKPTPENNPSGSSGPEPH